MAESYQIILTKAAKNDINGILDYLLDNVSYEEAVDTRKEIIDAISSLTEMPSARSPVREVAKPSKPIIYRQVLAKKVYRIVFRINEEKKQVVLFRAFHANRSVSFVRKALE